MIVNQKPLRLTFVFPIFNAGEITRGIQVANRLKKISGCYGRPVEICFLATKGETSIFNDYIMRAGYAIEYVNLPPLTDYIKKLIMQAEAEGRELFSRPEFADYIIRKTQAAIRLSRPDFVIQGFAPSSNCAVQLLGVPSLSILPYPPSLLWFKQRLEKALPKIVEEEILEYQVTDLSDYATDQVVNDLMTIPFLSQPSLSVAAKILGLRAESYHLFTFLAGNVQLVADLPDFYLQQDIGKNCFVTGPLFARGRNSRIPPKVTDLFSTDKGNKVYISMGSSGTKKYVIEAIKAVATGDYDVVITVLPAICTIEEIKALITIPKNIFLTEKFLPADIICSMADVAVIHGGQGTVQTALSGGTPILGVAMQMEQWFNLDNIVQRGAGIRLSKKHWQADKIRESVNTILENKSFKENAMQLKKRYQIMDGAQEAAKRVWSFMQDGQLGR